MSNYTIELQYKNGENEVITLDFAKMLFFQRIVNGINLFRVENKDPIANGKIFPLENINHEIAKMVVSLKNIEIFNSENFGEVISQKYFFGSYAEGQDALNDNLLYEYIEIIM